MKIKIIWSLIGCMIVASLILVSCAGGGGGGNGGNGGPPPTEEPQYGGTLTYVVLRYGIGFDPLVWGNNRMLSIIFDRYFTVPWEKGPAGTHEIQIDSTWNPKVLDVGYEEEPDAAWYPQQDYRGEMIESWKVVDLYTVNYKLRQGIHYWNKEPVNGRELTVDDIMWNWLYDTFNPRAGTYLKALDPSAALQWWTDYLAEIESGKFTDERLKAHLAECKQYTPEWESYYPGLQALVTSKYASSYSLLASKGYDVANLTLLNPFLHKIDNYNFETKSACCGRDWSALQRYNLWAYINAIWPTPPEVTKVDGFTNWETLVATGPWIPTNFEPGSEVTFKRNPDYWQYDPLHPENQLPYADELVILAIDDESTYYAALETAQLDVGGVEWSKINYFQENYPDMLYIQGTNTWTHCIFVRNDIPPFSDIRVRKACMLGIDHQAIISDHYKGMALINTWPEQPQLTDIYTPLNQLPAEIQELFTYNPTKAKQLLVDAGYPDGFSTTLTVCPSSEDKESCQIFQNYMKDIGINIKINVTPDVDTYGGILYGRAYEHMCSCWFGNNFPGDAMFWAEGGLPTSPYNFGRVVDPISYETSLAIFCMADDNQYYAAIKADDVRRLGRMYEILLPTPVGYVFWWPWLKGFHGERDLGWPDECGWGEIPKYLWIDQALKTQMGY